MAQSPAQARSGLKTTIRDILTNKPITTGFFRFPSTGGWDWISLSVATHADCEIDAVDVLETEAGDVITVNGQPAAYVERGWINYDALLAAAFPVAAMQAAE